MGYEALITGESIGQASSQTLKNLSAIERAVGIKIPVLRPLLGLDKEEVIEYSRRIGLYEYSSRVFEACAIAPTRVVTAASPEEISRYLSSVDASVIEKAVNSARVYDVLSASPEDVVLASSIELDFIPENAVVVDVRRDRSQPLLNSIPLSEVEWEKLRDKVIVLVCETGSLSHLIARELRELGYKAFSSRGGVKGCSLLSARSSKQK
jgi:thiamine biosynthesis protein ThiI